jgi:ribosomal protein L11 methyltransferase
MAFGTGAHATTLNCLRFLVDFASTRTGSNWTALDLGCGSGILALAARQLGAKQVLAADFDPECVRITRENSEANGLRGVTVRKLDVLTWEPQAKFDLVAANLYSTILVAIAPKLARSIAPGGMLIFSGVMRDQEAEVSTAFKKAGLKVTETKRQGKWVAGTVSLKK